MLSRLKDLGDRREHFAFESTLSSRSFAPFLRGLKANGYQVSIYYFSLSSASLAIRRVKLRVALGGHFVPDDIVRRRFNRSIENFFHLYRPLADHWTLFDNSHSGNAEWVAEQTGPTLKILLEPTWQKMLKLSAHSR